MKLATLKSDHRDGRLVVVSKDLRQAVDATSIASNLQEALENWDKISPVLQSLSDQLTEGKAPEAFEFDPSSAAAPLPRSYQWCDGSAFLNHGNLMQKAYNHAPIKDMETIPLMYQGGSDDFLGPHDDILVPDESLGIDFEGEFGVIVDDVPMGCSAGQAAQHIKLIVQLNDVSLRALGPREMQTGFGFFQTKPSTSFAPVAITPDELGSAWSEGRVKLPLKVTWNDTWFGHPNGQEMNFSFFDLIAHAARTRRLHAGTLIGSGTVSNADRSVGSACISERRAIELIEHGSSQTGFMRFGDRIRMEARSAEDQILFGAINQTVAHYRNGEG